MVTHGNAKRCRERKSITVDEETYWMLQRVKSILRARTWREMAEKLLALIESGGWER